MESTAHSAQEPTLNRSTKKKTRTSLPHFVSRKNWKPPPRSRRLSSRPRPTPPPSAQTPHPRARLPDPRILHLPALRAPPRGTRSRFHHAQRPATAPTLRCGRGFRPRGRGRGRRSGLRVRIVRCVIDPILDIFDRGRRRRRRWILVVAGEAVRGGGGLGVADGTTLFVALRRTGTRASAHHSGFPFFFVDPVVVLTAAVGFHLHHFVPGLLLLFDCRFHPVSGGCGARVWVMTGVHPAGFSWLTGCWGREVVVDGI